MSIGGAVALALTGELIEPPPQVNANSAAEFAGWLASVGWDANRLRTRRDESVRAGIAWPARVESAARHSVGAAQWYAIIRDVITAVGLDPERRPPIYAGTLDPDDLRLLAEVPPHHVHTV